MGSYRITIIFAVTSDLKLLSRSLMALAIPDWKEVENDAIKRETSLGETRFPLPWLLEEE